MIRFYQWLFESTEIPSQQEMLDVIDKKIKLETIPNDLMPSVYDAIKVANILMSLPEKSHDDEDILDISDYFPASKIKRKYFEQGDRQKSALLSLVLIHLSNHFPQLHKKYETFIKTGLSSGVPAHLRTHIDVPRNY